MRLNSPWVGLARDEELDPVCAVELDACAKVTTDAMLQNLQILKVEPRIGRGVAADDYPHPTAYQLIDA